MDTTTRTGNAPGDLRVSDADRDRALTELGEHYQAGRLTIDELDERSGKALQAKTGKELELLFADLPRGAGSTAVSATTDAGLSPRVRVPAVLLLVLIVAVVGSVSVVTSRHGARVDLGGLVPLLVVCYLFRRRLFSGWRRP